MKKKIILILSIMILAACLFAVVAFASNYGLNFDSSYSNGTISVNLNLHSEFCFCTSSKDFGVGYLNSFPFFINIEYWHELFTQYGVICDDYDSFCLAIDNLINDKVICIDCSGSCGYPLYNYFDSFADLYFSYLKEPPASSGTYEEGLIAGKELGANEYKQSAEYASALAEKYASGLSDGREEGISTGIDMGYNNGYNQGKTDGISEGIEYYKSSTEYEYMLNEKYELGQADGIAAFMQSNEYATALDDMYNEGYDDGVSDTESDASAVNPIYIFIIITSIILSIILHFVFKKKRRY